jgi:hypothetical protein
VHFGRQKIFSLVKFSIATNNFLEAFDARVENVFDSGRRLRATWSAIDAHYEFLLRASRWNFYGKSEHIEMYFAWRKNSRSIEMKFDAKIKNCYDLTCWKLVRAYLWEFREPELAWLHLLLQPKINYWIY